MDQAQLRLQVWDKPASIVPTIVAVSAGEPAPEDEDLFGATVQLAARLCRKTATIQESGRAKLKGFAHAVHVYEVQWTERPPE